MTIKIVNTPNFKDELPTILWDNLFTKGSVFLQAGEDSIAFPGFNATTEDTVTFWQPTTLPAWLAVDMGTAVTADSAAIVGHNCFTKGNTVFIESSTNNTTWTTRATETPTDNSTLLFLFNPVSARYWRVRISSGTVPTISVAIIGPRFNFPAGIRPPYKPVWLSQSYELTTNMTIGGQFVGNKVQEIGGETQINLVSFERGFAESDLLPFRNHYNLGRAFVFASGPAIFNKDVGYVWRKENSIMAPTFDQNGSWMSASMEVYCYGK